MIVVLVFVSGCLFGACVAGLLMLGPRRSASHASHTVEVPERWDFPPAPADALDADAMRGPLATERERKTQAHQAALTLGREVRR